MEACSLYSSSLSTFIKKMFTIFLKHWLNSDQVVSDEAILSGLTVIKHSTEYEIYPAHKS